MTKEKKNEKERWFKQCSDAAGRDLHYFDQYLLSLWEALS